MGTGELGLKIGEEKRELKDDEHVFHTVETLD